MWNSLSEAGRSFILHPQTDPAALDPQGQSIIELDGLFVRLGATLDELAVERTDAKTKEQA